MKLAVMQPYLFPYIGYYQLAYCSDMFVFYDDVTYIKNGYINRNSVLTKNGRQLFTLPVNNASSFTLIKDLDFSNNVKKILSSIQQAYSKAPYFSDVYPIVEKILKSENRNVAYMTSQSIIEVFKYLEVDFKYTYSSLVEYDNTQDAKNKLYQFCDIFNSNEYINTIGGKELYHKDDFIEQGINLGFISCCDIKYKQFNNNSDFESNLSMIDILMNENKKNIKEVLSRFKIV
ncbi:WbqC family protein [Photobacterium leiognathi]|uniref:WbqC family protein n=1 Tax=Photobacterium leiognathi TaxID=553611 RepID=UPI0029816FD0|nr:WbqC family protein [Photobacterium leiognathi]